jgi:predicted Zn-dependent peptidase
MNRYNKLAALVLNLLLFVPGFAFAQESTIKKFEVNGVKVIFKPSVKEIISVRLFVDGGTSNYPKEMEGLENLALKTAVQGGTISLSKVAFNTEAEKIGTILQSSSSYDYGEISMNCIKPYWDKSWELFVDVVLQPAFNEKEFNLIKS